MHDPDAERRARPRELAFAIDDGEPGGQPGLAVAPREAGSFGDPAVEAHITDRRIDGVPSLWLAEHLTNACDRRGDGDAV